MISLKAVLSLNASLRPEEDTCATFNPDDLEDPAELNGTDLRHDGKIVSGEWCGMDRAGCKAACHLFLLPKKLVILLDKNKIANNMHGSI